MNVFDAMSTENGPSLVPVRPCSIHKLGEIADPRVVLPKTKLKLNLGSGINTCEGWTNVDGSWSAWLANHPWIAKILTPLVGNTWRKWPQGIICARLDKRLPFRDCSVDAIYTSHFLEHLTYDEGVDVLRECFRVLVPGGIIRIVVPDLEGAARSYLNELNGGDYFAAARFLERTSLNKVRLSPFRLRDWFTFWRDYHTHLWMFDRVSLIHELTTLGFVSVADVAGMQSQRISEISRLERADRTGGNGVGFAVEADKPHTMNFHDE